MHEKRKQQTFLAQKIHGEMSDNKYIQAEKSYGNGSDIKMFTRRIDIKKVDGNNLMAKDKALKNLTTLIIQVQFS